MVKSPLTAAPFVKGPLALSAGPRGELLGHAPVERATDLEPPQVALPVVGEERRFGLLARALRGGDALFEAQTAPGAGQVREEFARSGQWLRQP